jgi:DNA-binding NarL/FixJ family response regulator
MKRESPITLGIVDDQSLVREGLIALVRTMRPIKLGFEASSAAECLERLARERVDVLVVDVRMPKVDGIELVRLLRARGDATPVILLTTFDEPGLLDRAVRVGAQGFMLKDASPEEFEAAVASVGAGGTALSPVAPQRIRDALGSTNGPGPVTLTDREASILRLIAGGYSNKEIARSLGLVEGTIKNYVSEMLVKLDARDRTQAVLKAITMGLI